MRDRRRGSCGLTLPLPRAHLRYREHARQGELQANEERVTDCELGMCDACWYCDYRAEGDFDIALTKLREKWNGRRAA